MIVTTFLDHLLLAWHLSISVCVCVCVCVCVWNHLVSTMAEGGSACMYMDTYTGTSNKKPEAQANEETWPMKQSSWVQGSNPGRWPSFLATRFYCFIRRKQASFFLQSDSDFCTSQPGGRKAWPLGITFVSFVSVFWHLDYTGKVSL
jgi:hypothetical protein